MDHKHCHQEIECKHRSLKYCEKCDVVYCGECNREWSTIHWDFTKPYDGTTISYHVH